MRKAWPAAPHAPRGVSLRGGVLFALVILAFLWGSLAIQLDHDRNSVLTAAQTNATNLTRAYAEHVAGTLKEIDQSLLALKDQAERGLPTSTLALSVQAAIERNPGAFAAAVIAADGFVRASSPSAAEPVYAGDRDYFLAQRDTDTKQMFIGKPVTGRLSGQLALGLSRRVNNPDGSFAGVVLITLNVKYLSGFFADLVIGPHDTFAIVGTDMIVRGLILGSGDADGFIGKSVANSQLVPALAREPAGIYEAVAALDGIRRLFAYRSVQDYPIVVLVGTGYDAVFAGYFSRRFWLIAAAALASILLVGSLLLVQRSINLRLESESRFRALIENSSDLLLVLDRGGRILYRSPSARRVLGGGDDKVLGRSFVARLHPDDRAEAEAAMRRVIDAPDLQLDLRSRVLHEDGSWRNVAWSLRNGLDITGVNGLIVNSLDITESEKLQEQLRQIQRVEAVGTLAGGIAHDFNNLLGIITGNLDLVLAQMKENGELRDMLDDALTASRRGATLTRGLLAFARRQPLNPTVIDVGEIVRELMDLIRRTVPENIEIIAKLATDGWACEVDAGGLQNALLNLITNARDAMPAGGILTIETSNTILTGGGSDIRPGEYLVLAVSDTGSGMAPDVVARAFEPFFTTKAAGKGTGLGLSMVYGFAKQSAGDVKIDSRMGKGTTVRVFLPRSEKPGIREATTARTERQSHPEKILVVEDAPEMRVLALRLLHSLGYEAVAVGTAEEAFETLAGEPQIDLLLTDVILAGPMNGRQLAYAASKKYPALKVLYMSGYSEDAILNEGRLDPGVFLLQKPFTVQELEAALRAVLDQTSGAARVG